MAVETCSQCGTQFEYAMGRPPKTCSSACRKIVISLYKRAFRALHLEKFRAKDAAYSATHREGQRVRNAAYQATHREEIRVHAADYYAAHREAAQVRKATYQVTHQEAIRTYKSLYHATVNGHAKAVAARYRRRALKKGAFAVPYSLSEVFERGKWHCQICGENVDRALKHPEPMSASVDHVQPLTLLGPDTFENVQLAHLVCNLKKHAKYDGQLRFL